MFMSSMVGRPQQRRDAGTPASSEGVLFRHIRVCSQELWNAAGHQRRGDAPHELRLMAFHRRCIHRNISSWGRNAVPGFGPSVGGTTRLEENPVAPAAFRYGFFVQLFRRFLCRLFCWLFRWAFSEEMHPSVRAESVGIVPYGLVVDGV